MRGWLCSRSAAALLACFSACADAPPRAATREYAAWADPFEQTLHGPAQTARVCARLWDGDDKDSLLEIFCSGEPTPTSLAELETRLTIGSVELESPQTDTATHAYAHSLAVTGHSTGLSRRSVSAINPRVILQRTAVPAVMDAPATSRLLLLAFSRGEQLLELIVSPYTGRNLRFYVLTYRQACNDKPEGCAPDQLLTEATERDWLETSLYDETDLTNTVLDCAPCHQPEGPGSRKLLRMPEIDVPWTHWFMTSSEGGRALFDDFAAAHAGETFAGMTTEQIQRSDPSSLSIVVSLSGAQPNAFASKQIEQEVKDSAAALGGTQPYDNAVPGTSPTWLAHFERATRGEAIAAPYHDVKVTDQRKLERLTTAYRGYAQGELSDLPDIRDVYTEDPEQLAELGITTPPGLDGERVLIAACAQCHNERLDQSVSRARFRADLQGMDRAEKDLAIERLQRPRHDPLLMPPARLRVLTDDARARAIEALRR